VTNLIGIDIDEHSLELTQTAIEPKYHDANQLQDHIKYQEYDLAK
jgi:hypothetical protein